MPQRGNLQLLKKKWDGAMKEFINDVEGMEFEGEEGERWIGLVTDKKKFEKKIINFLFDKWMIDELWDLFRERVDIPSRSWGIEKYVTVEKGEEVSKPYTVRKFRARRKKVREKAGVKRNLPEDDAVEFTVLDYDEKLGSIEGTYEFKGCKGEWQDYEEQAMDIEQASGLSDEDFEIVSDILHQASPMFNDEFRKARRGVPWKIYLEE